ncbi:hypothetical protein ACQP3D_29565, partial [Escherichia coli]
VHLKQALNWAPNAPEMPETAVAHSKRKVAKEGSRLKRGIKPGAYVHSSSWALLPVCGGGVCCYFLE